MYEHEKVYQVAECDLFTIVNLPHIKKQNSTNYLARDDVFSCGKVLLMVKLGEKKFRHLSMQAGMLNQLLQKYINEYEFFVLNNM